jgi:dihydrofolate synthase/folylpolyglutamate synthase
VLSFSTVEVAYKQALANAHKDDLIIVFGSFYTVADVLKIKALKPQGKVE